MPWRMPLHVWRRRRGDASIAQQVGIILPMVGRSFRPFPGNVLGAAPRSILALALRGLWRLLPRLR